MAGVRPLADCRRGRDQLGLIGSHPEGIADATQEQRHFGGLRADVAVRLVQHDPPQQGSGALEIRPVLGA